MCGQFSISPDALRALETYAPLPFPLVDERKNETIFPGSSVPCLIGQDGRFQIVAMRFGIDYPGFKRRMINARAETVLDKPMFRDDFLHRRLCVPASSFYEWTVSKEKVAFFDPDEQTMFLAGFFQNGQFILLTHPANASMRPFHHRMPLLLRADQVKDWLFDTQKAIALLEQENGALRHWMSHQQGTLF